MEPVTTTIAVTKAAAEVLKKLYEVGKNVKDRDLKHLIDDIHEQVRELKQSASELEDQNRELREQLRFKSTDYEFRHPFYYDKGNPEHPLCPVCFAKKMIGHVSEPGYGCDPAFRRCLICGESFQVAARVHRPAQKGRFPRRPGSANW